MNTIQCPVCKQMLEGEFEMTDTIKCPSCETSFVPEKVLSRKIAPVRVRENETNSASSSQERTSRPYSLGPNNKELDTRPKQIVFAAGTLVGLGVFRHLILLGLILIGLSLGNIAVFETELPFFLSSCVFTFPLMVIIAWKVYRGKRWAKVAYVVFAILSMLSTSVYSFGMKAMSLDPKVHEFINFLPDWVLNTLTIWAIIALVGFAFGLRWINAKESREWLKSKVGSPINKPWWLFAALFDTLSIVAVVLLIVSGGAKASGEQHDAAEVPPAVIVSENNHNRSAQDTYEDSKRQIREENEKAKAIAERKEREERDRLRREEVLLGIIQSMIPIPGKDYLMSKTEVTQVQWAMVMGSNPSHFKGDTRPVEQVSWNDCHDFLEKLNSFPKTKQSGLTFRLPTEEEWSYACRAGGSTYDIKLEDGTTISIVNPDLERVAWFEDNCGRTQPVGQKTPNAFGLHDTLGNVQEWTQSAATARDSWRGRSYGGGGWKTPGDKCYPSCNFVGKETSYRDDLGFRLCASRSRSNDSGPETIIHTKNGNPISSNDASLTEEDRRLLVLLNHGKDCLTTAKNELALSHFDKAREKFQEAANYLGSDALDKKSEWTDSLLTEVYQGLAEVNYRQALDQYNHKEFQEALSTCREARRYRHPKAQELFQTIQNAQKAEQEKERVEKREAVESAVQRLKRAQEHLADNNLVPALEEYQKAEKLLESVIKSGDEAVLETMRVQMRNGIGEVHYRYALDFFKAKQYNEALAACRQAKSYNHPKAEALIQKIKKAKELDSK